MTGFTGPVAVRHCLNSSGCAEPSVGVGDAGIATLQIDQRLAIDPGYFEIKSEGPTFLAYPSRRWRGRRADMSVIGDVRFLGELPGIETGTVIVVMGDCIGSLEIRMAVGSGATITVDGSVAIYRGPGGWVRGRGSGSVAEFDKVPPGFRTVRGFNPSGTPVAAVQALVLAGAVTFVYFNFPVTEQ